MGSARLYYFHDPMCSWCWGYRPAWDRLRQQLPAHVSVVNILGGLAPDTDVPMPEELQQQIQSHWRSIEQQLGAVFNFDFWDQNQPRRATYPACRAVLAASQQGCEEQMIDAIQRAYYLRALNPSDDGVLLRLAFELYSQELDIDLDQFSRDLVSADTQCELDRQVALGRQWGVNGFPVLVLEVDGQRHSLKRHYKNSDASLQEILRLL